MSPWKRARAYFGRGDVLWQGGVKHGRDIFPGDDSGGVTYTPVFHQLTLSATETLLRHALNARTFPACTAVLRYVVAR